MIEKLPRRTVVRLESDADDILADGNIRLGVKLNEVIDALNSLSDRVEKLEYSMHVVEQPIQVEPDILSNERIEKAARESIEDQKRWRVLRGDDD